MENKEVKDLKILKLIKEIVEAIEKLAEAKNNSFNETAICLLNFALENLCDGDKKLIESKN